MEKIKNDSVFKHFSRLYACLNDWYDNINQVNRGVRSCERIRRIQNDGLIPLAKEYVLLKNFDINDITEEEITTILTELEEETRPDYETEAEEHEFREYNTNLYRVLLDSECRIARFAHDTAVNVNKQTIIKKPTDFSDSELEKLENIWSDWFARLDDLYWERRYRISKNICKEKRKEIFEIQQKEWKRKEERYPKLPRGTYVGGEKIY